MLKTLNHPITALAALIPFLFLAYAGQHHDTGCCTAKQNAELSALVARVTQPKKHSKSPTMTVEARNQAIIYLFGDEK